MDSDLVISKIATTRLPEADGENKKRKKDGMDSDMDSDLDYDLDSDLDSDPEADDDGVCTSWESAPSIFPWLAVIPGIRIPGRRIAGRRNPNKKELLFIRHDAKHHMPMPCSNIDLHFSLISNRDGWIMFVLHNGVVIIFNPVTGAQLQHLPSIYTCLKDIDYVFLADTLVAFAAYHADDGHLILATATPGDEAWSVIHLASTYNFYAITGIVFHDADSKFYAMDRTGKLLAFRLARSGRKTVVGEVSVLLKEREHNWFDHPHLVSDGSNLLQVRSDFEILKYCPDTDMWIEMTNIDLGNNSLFIDLYGAKLLPLPQGEEEEGRPRRNCIYFIHYEKIPNPRRAKELEQLEKEVERAKEEKEAGYIYVPYDGPYDGEEEEIEHLSVPHARIYDVSKGIVEPCFSTDIQSYLQILPSLMWFTPSLSVND